MRRIGETGRRALPATVTLLAAAFLLAAQARCADVQRTTLPADPLVGRQVFLQKGCQTCHAVWGEG